MNNDKLRQAGEKFREAAGLMCEWLSDQFEAITDVFNNMAKARTSANDALDALLTAHRAASRIREAPEGKSNNWLKMHGYPMRREVAGRHGRRKEHICRNGSGNCPEDNGLSKNKYQEPGCAPEIEPEVHNCEGEDLPAQRVGTDRSGDVSEAPRQPQLAVCDTGPGNQNIRRNQNGRRYSGGWPSRKR